MDQQLFDQNEKLLTTQQTADALKIKVETLATWRATGRYQIPFIKMGRKVLYKQSDIKKWLEKRTHLNTQTHQKLV